MKSVKKLWEILVPCLRNGKPVSVRHHREWDKVVRKISNGLTVMKPARGQWVHSETSELIEERVIPVRFMATEKQMKLIGHFTREHYCQHTTIVYEVSPMVHFFVE